MSYVDCKSAARCNSGENVGIMCKRVEYKFVQSIADCSNPLVKIMENEHTALSYHIVVRWLSRGGVLICAFKGREDIKHFLRNHINNWAKLLVTQLFA